MSSCAAPAGSPCRTGRGKVAAQYHTARFRLVPQLAKALSVPVPPLRRPGSAWTELPRPPTPGAGPAGHVRIGYARASPSAVNPSWQTMYGLVVMSVAASVIKLDAPAAGHGWSAFRRTVRVRNA
jgi:hypothetical protein